MLTELILGASFARNTSCQIETFLEINGIHVLCYNPNQKVKGATQREEFLWKTEKKLLQVVRCVAAEHLKRKIKYSTGCINGLIEGK